MKIKTRSWMMMHRNCQTEGMQTRPGFSVWTFTTQPPLRGFQAVCTTREPRLLCCYYYLHIAHYTIYIVHPHVHETNIFAQYLLLVVFSIFLLQWSAFVCCSVQYLLVAVDPHRFTILVFGCKHTWDRLNTITCFFSFEKLAAIKLDTLNVWHFQI